MLESSTTNPRDRAFTILWTHVTTEQVVEYVLNVGIIWTVFKFYFIYTLTSSLHGLWTQFYDGKKLFRCSKCPYPQTKVLSLFPDLQNEVCCIFRKHVFCSEHLKNKLLSAYVMHTSGNKCSECSEDKCPQDDALMLCIHIRGRVSK
jgi:hypothetical protein